MMLTTKISYRMLYRVAALLLAVYLLFETAESGSHFIASQYAARAEELVQRAGNRTAPVEDRLRLYQGSHEMVTRALERQPGNAEFILQSVSVLEEWLQLTLVTSPVQETSPTAEQLSEELKKLLETGVAGNPVVGELWGKLARVYLQQEGFTEKGLQLLDRAMIVAPLDNDVLLANAMYSIDGWQVMSPFQRERSRPYVIHALEQNEINDRVLDYASSADQAVQLSEIIQP